MANIIKIGFSLRKYKIKDNTGLFLQTSAYPGEVIDSQLYEKYSDSLCVGVFFIDAKVDFDDREIILM